MRTWLDNTGLHAAARALRGAGDDDSDYWSLLQLATLLLFGDSLAINGFERDHVRDPTNVMLESLVAFGFPEDKLHLQEPDRAMYVYNCGVAADRAADELRLLFVPSRKSPAGLEPDIRRDRGSAYLHKFVDGEVLTAELPAFAEEALEDKAAGAVLAMLVASDELMENVLRFRRETDTWTFEHTIQLDAFLRTYLNDVLASAASSRYAPAVGRASLIRQGTARILDTIGNQLDDVAAELRGQTVSVPALIAKAVWEADGDPERLLRSAIRLRGEVAPIRKELQRISDRWNWSSPLGEAHGLGELEQLSATVESRVLKGPPPWRNNIDFSVAVSSDSAVADGALKLGQLMRWASRAWRTRRTVALTEYTRIATSRQLDPKSEKLRRRCLGDRA